MVVVLVVMIELQRRIRYIPQGRVREVQSVKLGGIVDFGFDSLTQHLNPVIRLN